LIEYVPCELACKESLDRARQIHQDMVTRTPEAVRDLESHLKNPHLLFAGQQGASVELIPKTEPGQRFQYTVGRVNADGPDVERVLAGDELIIEPECLTILTRGVPSASLSGRAYLWWYKQAIQQDFWQAIVDFKQRIPEDLLLVDKSKDNGLGDQGNTQSRSLPAIMVALIAILEKMAPQLGVWELSSHKVQGERLQITLATGASQVILTAEEATPDAKALFKAGPYNLSHPKEHHLKTQEQWRGAKAFIFALEKGLK
jgi:hypothetical protein